MGFELNSGILPFTQAVSRMLYAGVLLQLFLNFVGNLSRAAVILFFEAVHARNFKQETEEKQIRP